MRYSARTGSRSRGRSRKGANEVLTVIVQVNAPPGHAIGVKEDIAMRLEPLGDVRVVSVTEGTPEQLHVEGYRSPQNAPGRKGV